MYSDSLASLLVDQSRQTIRYDALLPHRIRNILLVSSLYDSYTFVEDGGVNDMLFSDYSELNLRSSPRIDRVSTARRALDNLKTTQYDLVISMLRIGEMNVLEFGKRVKELQPDLPVLLLAFNSKELSLLKEMDRLPGIDNIFVWSGDSSLFLAMVMHVEDKLNAWHDARAAGVQIIILIEDSIHYYSSFLPILYTEIMKQTRNLMADGLNQMQKMQRQRARTKVLLANSYEEGEELFEKYKDQLIGTIVDAAFPRNGVEDARAGVEFAKMVRTDAKDRAVLLQSSDTSNELLANELGVAFLHKSSPTLLQDLRQFMQRELGFGDFVFRRMDDSVVTTATDLRGFCEALELIPDESLIRHSLRKDFSTWLRARTEFEVAKAIRSRSRVSFRSTYEFRKHLISSIKRHQSRIRAGIVSDFSDGTFEGTSGFVRIGRASLGGKGRGLAFLNSLVETYHISEQIPGVRISIPPTAVLATDVFDEFVEVNGLQPLVRGEMSDEEIDKAMLSARLSDEVIKMLRTFLSRVHYPLAVRSSSQLEDSSHQPFAGIYKTIMIPNNNDSGTVRLQELRNAIKLVYASTFKFTARSYLENTPNRLEEEKMAVVIQQVVGQRHDQYLYPDVAGVARSHNFYPMSNMKASDGVISLVLGLGRTAVEGGRGLRFSPVQPESIYELLTPRDYLNNAQRELYALNLSSPGPGTEEDATGYTDMKTLSLDLAHLHGTFRLVGSVYSPREHAILDDPDRPGVKLVTMANLFKDPELNLAKALSFVLRVGEAGLSCPVEVEFAANVKREKARPIELCIVQIRPMVIDNSGIRADVDNLNRDNALCVSGQALGHGFFNNVRDIIFVRQDTFKRSATQEIADEIGTLNVALKETDRPFVLIGPGRWGSADPRLGIPVSWGQISKVSCIVETPLTDLRVSPSQGSHFFQNITSFGIGYFTISSDNELSFLNTRWLQEQPAATNTPHVCHVTFDKPLDIVVDSSTGIGAIMKPGHRAARK